MSPSNYTTETSETISTKHETEKSTEYRIEPVYSTIFAFIVAHLGFFYGFYRISYADIRTFLFAVFTGYLAGLGVTAGAHRLWCHNSYKAKLPLRIFLMIWNCMAAQHDLYRWCRDHRVHHKYVETDADPHNIKRGFFFAHMGWLLCKKHPDVTAKGKTIYMDDLLADPVVRFQRRFYVPLAGFFSFFLPTIIPMWLWNETLLNSFFICALGRYSSVLNATFLINSMAHMYGVRPYDKNSTASENPFASFITNGEGWHNYHHAFPWDYSASELGYKHNFTKKFIDFMAKIGQAYNLKTADSQLVKNMKLKAGDGTRLENFNEY